MSLRLVPALGPGVPGDPGATGPRSMTWRVARERAVVLGGLSALLLQLAHPLVAAAVAEHSRFREDPVRRLMQTLELLLVTAFGDVGQADAIAGRIASVHRFVHGVLPQPVGAWPAGTPYAAADPELCLWVHATIIEVALDSFSLFVRPLSRDERAQYYRESESFARLFGIGNDIRPADYGAFQDYYHETLGRLAVGSPSRVVAHAILRSRMYGIPIAPVSYLLAAGLLPGRIRADYGLRWSVRERVLWRLLVIAVRAAMGRLAPARVRFWSHYRVAMARCGAG